MTEARPMTAFEWRTVLTRALDVLDDLEERLGTEDGTISRGIADDLALIRNVLEMARSRDA